ncbi:hypothetical protein ACIQ34_10060 [Ureibacillus sp. NPDC094379]
MVTGEVVARTHSHYFTKYSRHIEKYSESTKRKNRLKDAKQERDSDEKDTFSYCNRDVSRFFTIFRFIEMDEYEKLSAIGGLNEPSGDK